MNNTSKVLSIVLWFYFIGFGIILGFKGNETILLKAILVTLAAGFLYIGEIINNKK